jgi:hypothetical protein
MHHLQFAQPVSVIGGSMIMMILSTIMIRRTDMQTLVKNLLTRDGAIITDWYCEAGTGVVWIDCMAECPYYRQGYSSRGVFCQYYTDYRI